MLNAEQANERAGLSTSGHNHGLDWGDAGTVLTVFCLFFKVYHRDETPTD